MTASGIFGAAWFGGRGVGGEGRRPLFGVPELDFGSLRLAGLSDFRLKESGKGIRILAGKAV
ncbi:hypothetical protein ACIRVF_42835 [Kitasatospora sp. NPDC101157]|uniref:hypothetical protein n=1 Tax=Kitasatospora sp. NPDC101157 TaxID=3364098 RepID=UPI0038017AA7